MDEACSARSEAPRRQHFIPEFYLKRWRGADGKLVEWSRPDPRSSIVKPRRTAPKGTGYAVGTYDQHLPHQSGHLEPTLMKPMDDRASVALSHIEHGVRNADWPSDLRAAWVRFITSLELRHPDDIAALRLVYRERWLGNSNPYEERYQALRRDGDPLTVAEFFASVDPRSLEDRALRMIASFVNVPRSTERLLNMHWFVMEIPPEAELLTSDRPLIRCDLALPDAYWSIPISPTKLFWAVGDWRWQSKVWTRPPKFWAERANRSTVTRASRLAFARTDAQRAFVERNLSRYRTPSIFEAIHRDAEPIG